MCGIAGFIAPDNPSALREALPRVIARLRHRGPDDEGICIPPDQRRPGAVGLANRRLAILDLTPAGHQPMVSADGRWTVTFNGEIYNYRGLRAELESRGRRFRSRSDTEVLMQGFAEWGTALLPRLTGMFAFAIHDRELERVILARDHFGLKPLYYARTRDGFVFASEIPAVMEFHGLSRAVDLRRYHEFLVSGNTDFGDGTLLADVRQLPPAHFLEVPVSSPGAGLPSCYWQPDLEQELDCTSNRPQSGFERRSWRACGSTCGAMCRWASPSRAASTPRRRSWPPVRYSARRASSTPSASFPTIRGSTRSGTWTRWSTRRAPSDTSCGCHRKSCGATSASSRTSRENPSPAR